MRKAFLYLTIAALIVVLPMQASVAPQDNASLRRELSSYFTDIAKNSPTVLGGLSKSPETMRAIQERIAKMSDAELAQFRQLTAQTPDWKIAPEALASAFPPEVLEQVKRVGANYTENVPEGAEMREDVLSLVAVLKVLPEDKLKELGVDRQLVTSLEATFDQMSPLQAAMLQQQGAGWTPAAGAAIDALPTAMRRGAAALAEHGKITPADIDDLEKFRAEVVHLLRRIDNLPPETRKTLKTEAIRDQVHQLKLAAPDALFMVRHNLPPEMIDALDENVTFLERIANLSDGEKKELDEFRNDLASVFSELDQKEGNPEAASAADMLSTLGPEHLTLLKQGMDRFGNWRTALPVLYRTLASPDLQARLDAVQGENADPAAIASLEDFRSKTLAFIDAEASAPGADSLMMARAKKSLENAPVGRLEIMRMTLAGLGNSASKKDRLSVVLLDDINFNCAVDMPSPVPDISLDFICNPIEDALEAIRDGIVSTVNTIVAGVRSALETTINTVSSALNSAISAVTNTVNSIVSSIQNLANQIWSFIQTVPSLAWNAIKSALNLLLDIEIRNGITVRDLVARGAEHALTSMKTLLGLAEGWWNAVSTFTLPAIPCPPAGFHTPFGNVGESAAADNYGRYKLVIDGIVEMIPDTETSLAIKIPAQVLYMAFDFLGLCLEQAAANADSAEAASRHNIVLTSFTNLQAFIGTQVTGLSNQNQSQTNTISVLINTESSNIQTTLLNESTAIQALINNRSTSNQNFLSAESLEIQNLLQRESDDSQQDIADFRKLNLRLIIERVLQGGVGSEVASFQLMEPMGYLGLVRDVVRETIDSMSAAGQGVGQAQKFYETGLSLFNSGREKDAFKEFAKAYRDATK